MAANHVSVIASHIAPRITKGDETASPAGPGSASAIQGTNPLPPSPLPPVPLPSSLPGAGTTP